MPHSFGYRARTRDKFSKNFRQHGKPLLGQYLQPIQRGDYVDVMVDPSVQKGMPFHFYHGKTGVVYNVTRRAVGIEIKKRVKQREIMKRIHVRIEHVRKSRSREDYLRRRIENQKLREEAKKRGEKIDVRRVPEQPQEGAIVPVPAAGVIHMEVESYKENY
eukprot:Lankesteria_metandrocarpae@DN967_c0_g1_i10.p1